MTLLEDTTKKIEERLAREGKLTIISQEETAQINERIREGLKKAKKEDTSYGYYPIVKPNYHI
jgi:DNA invertase Pin-like site-specific DNA recombinase